ncbi:DNA/RNA non-specific endonuclease [Marinivivus vitaminiproducens]|uniref:DNA/RNA non-specific endonuclease n=1 Tax=Marinivivus vitaminiproducens TaxID=3035935 RepID=UPI002798DECF|nr:DNA/RNA non-specific endonuclease [Geminicoccaceae bacterium SCSIO 64248]
MARRIDPERLKRFLRTEAAAYLDRPDVTSVGIGYRIKDGKPTKELCIQFTVGRKRSPEALESDGTPPLPSSMTVDGVSVPTDVIERRYRPSWRVVAAVAEIEKDRRKQRLDPMLPGCSVSHPSLTAGTLGCLVADARDGSLCMLSNWHVLQGPDGRPGDRVVQPGPFDDNATDGNGAGILVRSHRGLAGDCAIARLDGRTADPAIIDLDTGVEKIGVPELGDRVVKSGRTTGVTRGVVTRIEVTTKLDYGDGTGEQKIGGFEIGIDAKAAPEDGEISKDGDSGAAWLACDRNGKPEPVMLGLHFAGEVDGDPEEHALACYAHAVFKKLEIRPLAGAEIERARSGGAGFDPGFLKTRVDRPKAGRSLSRDVLKVEGGTVVDHTHFSLAMSRKRRLALWVAWNIDGGRLVSVSRKGIRFALDPDVPEDAQVGDELYADNRLDRGHLARRRDLCWGSRAEAERANRDSFLFTNIAPQHQGFNQNGMGGLWGGLEDAIFADVEVEDLRVSVLAGPVFRDDDPVYREVAIPRAFWKIIAFVDREKGGLVAKGFVLTQDDLLDRIEALGLEPFKVYQVPLGEIETRTGLVFGALNDADERAPAGRRPERAGGGITLVESLADVTRSA